MATLLNVVIQMERMNYLPALKVSCELKNSILYEMNEIHLYFWIESRQLIEKAGVINKILKGTVFKNYRGMKSICSVYKDMLSEIIE